LRLLFSAIVAQKIQFNPEEMLWDARQLIRLPLIYLLLGIPFFFAANCIGLALSHFPANASRTYAADLAGAGGGSLAILGLLHLVFPSSVLRIISMMGFAGAAIAWWELKIKSRLLLAFSAEVIVWFCPAHGRNS
jgi:hypothetical protein